MRKRRRKNRHLPALVSQARPPNAVTIVLASLRCLDCQNESREAKGEQEHHALEQRDVGVIVEQGLEQGEHVGGLVCAATSGAVREGGRREFGHVGGILELMRDAD